MELQNIRIVTKDKNKPLSQDNCEIIANGHRISGAKTIEFDNYGKGLKFVTVVFHVNTENELASFPLTLEQVLNEDKAIA